MLLTVDQLYQQLANVRRKVYDARQAALNEHDAMLKSMSEEDRAQTGPPPFQGPEVDRIHVMLYNESMGEAYNIEDIAMEAGGIVIKIVEIDGEPEPE